MSTTLPTDSQARKEVPIVSGCLDYFPAALAGVARVSYQGNQKHNPGEPIHHARGKSTDHADCIVRHLIDLQDMIAAYERYHESVRAQADRADILAEASALAWRALALSQELHERFGAPLAPGARLPAPDPIAQPAEVSAVRPVREVWTNSAEAIPHWQPRTISAAAPLRLEVGKRYVQRGGDVTSRLASTGDVTYPYGDYSGYTYSEDGSWGTVHGVNTSHDLVAEYIDPSAAERAVADQE